MQTAIQTCARWHFPNGLCCLSQNYKKSSIASVLCFNSNDHCRQSIWISNTPQVSCLYKHIKSLKEFHCKIWPKSKHKINHPILCPQTKINPRTCLVPGPRERLAHVSKHWLGCAAWLTWGCAPIKRHLPLPQSRPERTCNLKWPPPTHTKCNRCQRPTAHHARQDLRIHTVGRHLPRVQVCVHLWFCFLRAGLKPQQTLADMINTHQSASSSSSNLWLCLSACLSVPSVPPLSYWWTHIMTAGVLRHEASYKLATHGGRYQVISYQGPTPKSAPFNETRRVKCEL